MIVPDLFSREVAGQSIKPRMTAELIVDALTMARFRHPDQEYAELDATWDQEIRHRVAAVEAGTARLVSAEEVHAAARKIYQR